MILARFLGKWSCDIFVLSFESMLNSITRCQNIFQFSILEIKSNIYLKKLKANKNKSNRYPDRAGYAGWLRIGKPRHCRRDLLDCLRQYVGWVRILLFRARNRPREVEDLRHRCRPRHWNCLLVFTINRATSSNWFFLAQLIITWFFLDGISKLTSSNFHSSTHFFLDGMIMISHNCESHEGERSFAFLQSIFLIYNDHNQ